MPHPFLSAAAAVTLSLASAAPAQDLANLQPVGAGFTAPIAIVQPPGEPTRLLIVQQNGTVRVIENGVLRQAPFMVVPVTYAGEEGLLGFAFAPDYPVSRRFYFYASSRVAPSTTTTDNLFRGSTAADDPNVAKADVELLLTTGNAANHNGGCLQFGPEGYLHISSGERGDPRNAPLLTTLKGKILRIDASPATGYAVPPANPFVGSPTALPEILDSGVRNPWRFSFDRARGDLWVADVGSGAREEINVIPAAEAGRWHDFGWPACEGLACTGGAAPAGVTQPVFDYRHSTPPAGEPSGCAITGGYVYRGDAIPRWRGRYFFGDYCQGTIWSFRLVRGGVTDLQNHTAALGATGSVTSFGEDLAGELYVTGSSGVRKIVPQFGPADFDLSGETDANDISAYLNAWYAAITADSPAADFDGDNETTANDLSEFINVWYRTLG